MKLMNSDEQLSNPSDWRELYPFDSHWLELGSDRLHYLDEATDAASRGDRETLLFVHGNPTWSFHWRNLIAALRSRYRCVAPDHLGCGLSDKPRRLLKFADHVENLVALVERLDLERVTLVAQDWGGAIGFGGDAANAGAAGADRAFQHGRVSAAIHSLANSRVPPARRRPTGRPGRRTLQPRRAADDARPPARLEPTVAAGYLAPYDSWANRRAVYGFVKDIPSGPRIRRGRCSPKSSASFRRSPIGPRYLSGACAIGASVPIA